MSLELIEVSKSYRVSGQSLFRAKREMAVMNVSCCLEEGRTLGIVGSSGSGKSTLGKLIVGLIKPDAGDIRYKGESLLRPQARQRLFSELQMVFQDSRSAVNSRMTIKDIVAEPIQHRERLTSSQLTKRVGDLLTAVELRPEEMNGYPHQISGGQLQRVCIARALAAKPRLIVWDEAISSLDAMTQWQMIQLLQHLQKEYAMSYVFITHNLQAVRHLADELIVMSRGAVVEHLQDAKHLDQLRHPESQRLVQAMLTSYRST